jgi:hypothetical protein
VTPSTTCPRTASASFRAQAQPACERRGLDGDAALGEPAREEVKVEIDDGLTGVEGDDGRFARRVRGRS